MWLKVCKLGAGYARPLYFKGDRKMDAKLIDSLNRIDKVLSQVNLSREVHSVLIQDMTNIKERVELSYALAKEVKGKKK